MATSLRVLIVEDSEDDARLLHRKLQLAGYDVISECVASADAMRAALASNAWDLILCDYVMPDFSGLAALAIAQESGLDVPFIVVSGQIDEQTAVDAMKAGASDFVTKAHLERLAPAVKRELGGAAARHGMRLAQIEWRAAFDAMRDASFFHDREFRIVRANTAYAELARMRVTDVLGKRYWEVFPKLDGPLPRCRSLAEDRDDFVEEELTLASGETYSSRSFRIVSHRGEYLYSFHVLQDVTERNRLRDAIETSEHKFRALIENASDLICVIDAQGRLTYVSPSVRHLGGYAVDEVLHRSIMEFTHPEDLAQAELSLSATIRSPGQLHEAEIRFRHKKGHYVVLNSIAKSLLDDPTLNGIVINARDVTERKRVEKELKRVNWALRALSESNSALVRESDEQELLVSCCKAITSAGGYSLAWIGLARNDADYTVEPVAAAGTAIGYMEGLQVSWGDSLLGRGLPGTAIRSGRTQVSGEFETNAAFEPWLERARTYGLLSSIALPISVEGAIQGALTIFSREASAFGKAQIDLFEELAADIGFGLGARRTRTSYENAVAEKAQQALKLRATFEAAIGALAATVEQRDPYTAGHQRRVATLAVAIGRELGLDEGRLEGLRIGSTIHDIGKICVPAEILARPGRLGGAEFEIVKSHAQVGYDIVKSVDFPWPVADMILQHHERHDGSGYPQGLTGDQIILEARILAVADVVEAMSSHRPYRPGLGQAVALEQVQKDAGTKLDPAVVAACLRLFRERGFELSPPR